jgi:hypothetical protein
MTSQNRNDILDHQLAEIKKIIRSKSQDYAGEDDVLKAFRQVGELLEIDMESVCHVFIGTKIVRLRNLSEAGRIPNHESIRDTIRDLQCYSLILEHIYLSQT